MAYRIKKLDDSGMAKLQALEEEMGTCIVAYAKETSPVASISTSQLDRLRAAEKEMNAVLVAYQCDKFRLTR